MRKGEHSRSWTVHGDTEVCNRTCSNMNGALQSNLEGLEQEILILESRLPPAISQNESDIDSLRIKQKDIEIVLRQQQETIYIPVRKII